MTFGLLLLKKQRFRENRIHSYEEQQHNETENQINPVINNRQRKLKSHQRKRRVDNDHEAVVENERSIQLEFEFSPR